MKKELRTRYELGEVQEIEKKLSAKNKKIINDFIQYCGITAGESKLEKIKRIIIQFWDITEIDLDKQTKETLIDFLVILNKSKRSAHTKKEFKVYLKKFIKWFYKDLDLVELIKPESIRNLNPEKYDENKLVTEKDIEKMFRFAENFKEKAFLFLIFESGARPQELLNLKWKDIKFEEDYADITLYSGKTNQSRIFPVNKAKEFLWEWKQNYSFPDVKSEDFVFVSRWRERHMTTAGLNKILRRLSEKAGIEKDIWNYLFRHSRATKLYEELPTPTVEKLMGHSNMYKVYAHISNKKAREQMLNRIYNIKKLTPEDKEEIKKIKGDVDFIYTLMKELNNTIETSKRDKQGNYIINPKDLLINPNSSIKKRKTLSAK